MDEVVPDNKTLGNIPKKNPDPGAYAGEVPRGERLRIELAGISSRVEELERAMALPDVNEDGSSECPFAENLYAKKEELEEQVVHDVEKLKSYEMALDKEIERCRGNLERIQTDGGRLNLRETSQRYSEAADAQQEQLQTVIDDKDAVCIVLRKAQAVLKVSRTRKFPGRKPQEGFPLPVPPLGAPGSSCVHPSPGQLGNELGGLISLGPLGKP